LFTFRDISYVEAINVEFELFRSHLLEVSHKMSETVDWGTLDPETQESLKAWAPKAKEYLETPRGAEGRSIMKSPLWSFRGADGRANLLSLQSCLNRGSGAPWLRASSTDPATKHPGSRTRSSCA
jgi:hypothetical protein